MRFPFFRNRDSVKNGILISIRRTGDGFHPGLFTNIAGSNLVIGSKKIILQEKVDIFVPPIVKSNTGIIIADASTDLNRIYAEVSGKIR